MSSDLSYMPATELAQAIRSRQVSSVEVTQHFYERIERLDSRLNSYLALCPGTGPRRRPGCRRRRGARLGSRDRSTAYPSPSRTWR